MGKAFFMVGTGLAICLIGLLITFSLRPLSIILIVLFGTVTVLLVLLLFQLDKQQRVMNFLIEEKKRRQGKAAVHWDEREERQLDAMKQKIQLGTLQSQINPHFLYNTLDSIRSRALLDGQQEIASMTEILSKFFRYCISNAETLVKIREELSHIQDYYYIQKYRFEDRFEMITELECEEVLDYYIPKMTLQPLVENAMIHGLEKVGRKGLLKVTLFLTEQKVIIIVSDNGAGMNASKLQQLNDRLNQMYVPAGNLNGRHNSIAVANVNIRIRMIFGEEYGIHYQSMENQGTDAIIRIPRVDDFNRKKYLES